MCRTFSPYKMKGIYFSLCASTQIKIYPFHLCLFQSHHILREQKHRFLRNLKNKYNHRNHYLGRYCFVKHIIAINRSYNSLFIESVALRIIINN